MMLFEGDYEEDDDDKNVTRCSFGLILFAYKTKVSRKHIVLPLKSVFSPITRMHDMCKKISLCSMHEIYFSENREMVRILSVSTYLFRSQIRR